ncbi:MAG: RNA ligase [bacterium]
MLELQKLIKNNPNNWKTILSIKPYSLLIKEKDNRVLFKYNQILSDFSKEIVKESRGIILDKNTWDIVCHPFHKFFNHNEANADKIDWQSASVLEKLDGSLIKFYFYKGKLKIATNGNIDASDSKLENYITPDNKNYDNYFELVFETLKSQFDRDWKKLKTFYSSMEKNATHLFEICTPYNKIVIPYQDSKLYYLTSKNNETGKEFINPVIYSTFPKPKIYNINSIDKCIEAVNKMPFNEEGYVVIDKNQNRIKIKSPSYLIAHHLKGNNGKIQIDSVLDLIRNGEDKEFLSYYPEYKEIFTDVKNKWKNFLKRVDSDVKKLYDSYQEVDRKTLAIWAVNETIIPDLIFSLVDKKVDNKEEYISSLKSEKILNNFKKGK